MKKTRVNNKTSIRCPACGQFVSLKKIHYCPTVILLARKLVDAKSKAIHGGGWGQVISESQKR